MPRTALELVEEQLAQDGNTVRPVQSNGADIEDGVDGNAASQTNEVDQDADKRVKPHRKDGGIRLLPDLVPNLVARNHLVTGEGPDSPATGLEGGDAHEVHDDEGGDGEEDGCALAHDIVEDLDNGLVDRRGEYVSRGVIGSEIQGSHAEGQHDGEEPADDVGEAEGGRDGGGDRDGGVLRFFGDTMRVSILVGVQKG